MWKYFFLLLWLSYILAAGIHLFSRGFLLSRVSLIDYNTCTPLPLCNYSNKSCLDTRKADELTRNINNSINYCLPPKSKVILLVIDALKYEFGLYNENLTQIKPYENKLPIIHQLLQRYPNRTRIGRFIADPPTTTLQRLKGLTTGSLPTFIDIGSNFDTPEINEDNIIDQTIRNNLTAVFMGDSTWVELFPNRFKRQYPHPSFNIYDLDTVDREIQKVLPKELKSKDWHLLIAHFLGVDHCGHKYGPLHQEMARKLGEMNTVIQNIVNDMDDHTMLLVVGDHGMTGSGDHGGDSVDETDALIFAYSKKQDFFLDDLLKTDEMYQIDLVPTLSIILGIPIPYSNLGKINFNLLPKTSFENLPFSTDHLFLLHSWNNALQMRQYFSSYTARNPSNNFPEETLDDQFRKFTIYSYRATTLYTQEARANFHKDLKVYQREMLELCRDIWVNFDAGQMCQGLLILSVSMVWIYLLVAGLKVVYFEQIFTKQKVWLIYGGNVVCGLCGWWLWHKMDFRSVEHAILLIMSVFNVGVLCVMTTFHWAAVTDSLSSSEKGFYIVPRIIFIFTIIVFFSNSFIVQEQKILCYILSGLMLLLLNGIHRGGPSINGIIDPKFKLKINQMITSNWIKSAITTSLTVIIIRSSYLYFRCREEQGNCTDFNTAGKYFESHNSETYQIGGGKNNAAHRADIVPVIVLAFFVTLTKMFLRFSGNQTGYMAHVLMAKFSFVITALAVGGHFVLSQTPRHGVKQINVDALAWIVYTAIFIHVLLILFQPLMVYILRTDNLNRIEYSNYIIPAVFNYLKKELANSNRSIDDRPFVIGVTAVYSSVLMSFAVTLTLVLALLLGAQPSIGLFMSILAAAVILTLSAIRRYETAELLENCLQPQYITLVTWTVLAQFSFYATGHQPTLSQIDWHAAFVGRSAIFDHTNYLSAIMILLNTFGGQIIIYFLYPMLILIGPNLLSKWPNLISKSKIVDGGGRTKWVNNNSRPIPTKPGNDDNGDNDQHPEHINFIIGRGELVLFDNEELFIGTLFKVAGQLLILQSLRVFCSMLACTIHARHLMVWKIFAPKFMYEGLATYLCFMAILLSMALVLRTHSALSRLIAKLVN